MTASQLIVEKQLQLKKLLVSLMENEKESSLSLQQKAILLARHLQKRATELQTPQERKQQAELDRMIQNPQDKVTLMQMTDQTFRSNVPQRAVDQLIHILDVQGIPRFFSRFDRTLLRGFQSFGDYLPGVAVPLVKEKMHKETANVVLPAEKEMLAEHLNARRDEGVRMNVNFLGEALLGEEEAERRLKSYLQALQMDETEVISVKISTIYSQITPLSRANAVAVLSDRMELLYRASAKAKFERNDGSIVPKFVYLDMEEYRDIGTTANVFMKTLDRAGLENVSAGIALQAYIPDSYLVQQEITAWAKERVTRGGASVTIRVVKGANMEMERVESSIHGLEQPPYQKKIETDANYKRMLQFGMQPENLNAVRIGIASHNLFDLAYGLVLAVEEECLHRVQFEMLEGMANHQRRALFELTSNMLLYAPACKGEDFINAIGYLIRRLDENTGPENFLRHAFKIEVGSEEWKQLEAGFLKSFDLIETLQTEPRRSQNRLEPQQQPKLLQKWREFQNEPDTDFSLPNNLQWAKEILQKWEPLCGQQAIDIPLVVAGKEIFTERTIKESLDPSRPGIIVGRYRQANDDDIQQAIQCAKEDATGWRSLSSEKRIEILDNVAHELRLAREDLMGAAVADGGKLLSESDAEVSEAIDFATFYSRTAKELEELQGIDATGKGVVVVVSPWNFPIAIPCGGIAAALAAGNCVILKPASDAVLVAYLLCQCFWKAGVDKKALQFAPCSGATVGQKLVSHVHVDSVILTGGTETALTMLQHQPNMHLLAETGGKNATIVTSMSDHDQAIKHLLQSAFGHSGQKCSATSLLILEEDLFHDEKFKQTLCDAVKSLTIGSAWNLSTRMGPLIKPPEGALETALKELEPGESWAVLPHQIDGNPQLYSPAIKWNVQPGSFTHMTEFFGPVLGVMKAKNLEEAVELVNQTGFGLTSGLESLDDREQRFWKENIRAGNLYINRVTTGAIVLRQPFGGMGKSIFGPGIKAGGPNYVAQLMTFKETTLLDENSSRDAIQHSLLRSLCQQLSQQKNSFPEITDHEIRRIESAIISYEEAMQTEFSIEHDHFKLVGEDNIRRYLPVAVVRVRVHPDDSFFETVARIVAAHVVGCRVVVSQPLKWDSPIVALLERLTDPWAGAIEFVEESDEELATVLLDKLPGRIRFSSPERLPDCIRSAVAQTGMCIIDTPVSGHGRIELLWYMREQSMSFDYHRYGNLGQRTKEKRGKVL